MDGCKTIAKMVNI
jgi:hypothetical protein